MSDNFLNKTLRKLRLTVSVLEHPKLPAPAKVIFAELLLAFHNTQSDRCDPGLKTIGRKISRDEKNVRNAIGELEAAGLITLQRRGPNTQAYAFPGLVDDLEVRAISPGLETQDRANSSQRLGEIIPEERAISPNKPEEGTNKENQPSLR
jgi:hypothetical protein